jgi:hypothetical protein
LRDEAIRTLAEWNDASALPDLRQMLDQPDPDRALDRALAFRGYARLLRDAELDSESRFDHVRHAMALARTTEEKRMVLGALGNTPSVEAIELAADQLSDEQLGAEAASAILRIAMQLDPALERERVVQALNRVVESGEEAGLLKQAREQIQRRQ